MRILILASLVFITAVFGRATSSNAAIMVGAQLLPISNPTDSQTDAVFASDVAAVSISQQTSYPGLTEFDELQVFSGSASANATPDSYRLETQLTLQNYLRSNYVWTESVDQNGDPYFFITTPAISWVSMSDTVTVTGGTGVYSLNYILGLDGLIGSDSALMSATLQISLSLPEGVGQTTFYTFGPNDVIPSEITLTYDQLPFGGPVNPTLDIYATVLPSPLFEADLPAFGNDLITGAGSVQFGSTVTLKQLTATDPNGNLLSGLSLSSLSNYTYPTDPDNLTQGVNTVPEPSTFTIMASMLAMAAVYTTRRKRLTKNIPC